MRIVKFFRSWVLAIGTSALLVSGFVQAYDPDDRITPSRPGILPRDSLVGPFLSAMPHGSAGADLSLRPGARLQLFFAATQGDRVEPGRPGMEGLSDVTLRWGPIRLGGAPFLPWMEFYPEHDFKERGLSSEPDLHGKGIDDRLRESLGHLRGGYFQVGYFFPEFWERVPGSLEITGRVALAGTGTSARSYLQEEWTLGASWFFRGWFFRDQRNKITADVSYREPDHPDAGELVTRFHVRWDISF